MKTFLLFSKTYFEEGERALRHAAAVHDIKQPDSSPVAAIPAMQPAASTTSNGTAATTPPNAAKASTPKLNGEAKTPTTPKANGTAAKEEKTKKGNDFAIDDPEQFGYSSRTKASHTEIILNSRKKVQDAESGSLDQVGRVCNEFPYEYKTAKGQIIYSVAPEVMNKWLDEFYVLVNLAEFEPHQEEYELKQQNKSTKIQAHSVFRIVNPNKDEIIKRIHLLVQQIILHACKELLDHDGNLLPEYIQIFNLQNLFAKFANLPHGKLPIELYEIKLQIIWSYVANVVIGNLHDLSLKKFKLMNPYRVPQAATNKKAIRDQYSLAYDTYNQKSSWLQKFITDSCCKERMVRRDKANNEILIAVWTTMYKESINKHINELFTDLLSPAAIHAHAAQLLTQIPAEKVYPLILHDIERAKSCDYQFIPAMQRLKAPLLAMQQTRINFWIGVLEVIRQNSNAAPHDPTHYRIAQVIFGALGPFIDRDQLKNDRQKLFAFLESAPEMLAKTRSQHKMLAFLTEPAANAANNHAEQKALFPPIACNENTRPFDDLANLIYALHHHHFINHFIVIIRNINSPAAAKMIAKIELFKNTRDFVVQVDGNVIFDNFARIAVEMNAPEIALVATSFKNAIEYAVLIPEQNKRLAQRISIEIDALTALTAQHKLDKVYDLKRLRINNKKLTEAVKECKKYAPTLVAHRLEDEKEWSVAYQAYATIRKQIFDQMFAALDQMFLFKGYRSDQLEVPEYLKYIPLAESNPVTVKYSEILPVTELYRLPWVRELTERYAALRKFFDKFTKKPINLEKFQQDYAMFIKAYYHIAVKLEQFILNLHNIIKTSTEMLQTGAPLEEVKIQLLRVINDPNEFMKAVIAARSNKLRRERISQAEDQMRHLAITQQQVTDAKKVAIEREKLFTKPMPADHVLRPGTVATLPMINSDEKAELQDLQTKLEEAKYSEAAASLAKLRPIIVKHLNSYLPQECDSLLNRAMINEQFRKARNAAVEKAHPNPIRLYPFTPKDAKLDAKAAPANAKDKIPRPRADAIPSAAAGVKRQNNK